MVNPVTALASAARGIGHAARAMALDAVAATAHSSEQLAAALRSRPTTPATLRVRVVILSDEAGRPLTSPESLEPALLRADEVWRAGADVRVRATGVEIVTEPAPTHALDPRANRALLLDHLLGRTEFIDRHAGRPPMLSTVGDPITVVVVRRIAGKATGCSLGGTADWVICQASLFDAADPRGYDETVLAHELGHALNLPHVRDASNLMHPISSPPNAIRGTDLRRWQAALARSNRHIVPGR